MGVDFMGVDFVGVGFMGVDFVKLISWEVVLELISLHFEITL